MLSHFCLRSASSVFHSEASGARAFWSAGESSAQDGERITTGAAVTGAPVTTSASAAAVIRARSG